MPGTTASVRGSALVTGAARRLGRAMAVALAEDGYDLALHVRKVDDDALRLREEIDALGRRSCLVTADLAVAEQRDLMLAEAEAAIGPLCVLVNSAATFPDDRFGALRDDHVEAVLRVDLVAPLMLAQAFAQRLPASTEGLIVNLLDQRILKPTERRFSYTLAKSALWMATRMMARDLAPRIRVVGIGPGIAIRDPDMNEAAFERLSASAPLQWTGDAAEVVAALRYFVSARSVTGQMLLVDGGMHLA